MLPPDKHTTKVAICRGTPKSKFESASHDAVRAVFVSGLEKCGKQEIQFQLVIIKPTFG